MSAWLSVPFGKRKETFDESGCRGTVAWARSHCWPPAEDKYWLSSAFSFPISLPPLSFSPIASYPPSPRLSTPAYTRFFTNRRRAHTRSYKDSEVRPGRVSELYTNVRGNHNVVIYCRARHCGRLSRGRCDGSRVGRRENSFRIVRTRPDARMRFDLPVDYPDPRLSRYGC